MTATIMAPATPAQHFLSVTDVGPAGVAEVLDHAWAIKRGVATGPLHGGPLAGRAVALLFDQPSVRTRVSFEVGIARLGGATVSLSGTDVGLGHREAISDLAQNLSRYVDAIVARILSHETLTELATYADVPVINALTQHEHPCQALADLLTIRAHLGSPADRQLVFIGEGNNVAHSLLLAGASVGLHVRIASPPGYEPDPRVVDEARGIALDTGARIELTNDPVAAVRGADAVYTDVWASMGSEHLADERRAAFSGFRVTAELMRGAPDAIVMHCLPAHRGNEIDAEVIDGPKSVVFDQAENRLYVQQAVLLRLMGR